MSEATVFTYPLLIRESHLDTFGHVNNAVYLQLFEEARWQIIATRGYGVDKVRELAKGPVILEIQMSFRRELRLRTEIVIHTQTISYSGKIGELRQWMTNSAREICCEATFKLGLFDLKERKLIAPTAEWLHAIGMANAPAGQ